MKPLIGKLLSGILAVALITLVPACGEDGGGPQPCSSDSDCDRGYACESGACKSTAAGETKCELLAACCPNAEAGFLEICEAVSQGLDEGACDQLLMMAMGEGRC